jgi:predicted DNA-binding transcriptional regulator YafY
MLETSARLLRVLALLQVGGEWSGGQLADRLGVTTRTVRNDLHRLRSLGYQIHSRPGRAGGYRLAAGSTLPPLLLEDDEAVAIAISLRAAALGTVTGIEETAVRALAKLERTLPARLRAKVQVLRSATAAAPAASPTVDADVLDAVATAIHRQERLRLVYTNHGGEVSHRDIEPHRLVYTGRRWYVFAWDLHRGDWRTFRADRIHPKTPTGPRFSRREPPGDEVTHVLRGVTSSVWPTQARVRLHASAATVAQYLDTAAGVITADGPSSCILETGGPSLHQLAGFLASLDMDFEVLDPPELRHVLTTIARRCAAAAHQ